MSSIWTPSDESAFHTAIFKLAKLRQTPEKDVNYRDQQPDDLVQRTEHTLSFAEELQLADHMAFLCHVSEGFAAISAACIEEQPHKSTLIIRVARNHMKEAKQVEGLQNILHVVERFAKGGIISPSRI